MSGEEEINKLNKGHAMTHRHGRSCLRVQVQVAKGKGVEEISGNEKEAFQMIRRFVFSNYIIFAIHLNIHYI